MQRPPADFDLELPADPTLPRAIVLVQTSTACALGVWALQWAHAAGLLLHPAVAAAAFAWMTLALFGGAWAYRRAPTTAPGWRLGWAQGAWWWHRLEQQPRPPGGDEAQGIPQVHVQAQAQDQVQLQRGRLILRLNLAGWLLIEARRERGGSDWMLGRTADRRLRVALNWA